MAAGKKGAVTPEEKAALREWQREKRRSSKTSPQEDEAEVLAKIAELPQPDRAIAERIHDLVKKAAPQLAPRTWYGMPAYSLDGKVLCFFQPASKFKARYGTLGFTDKATLDDGKLWPTSFAVTELDAKVDEKISNLVKAAVG
jgi:uncharacterized protein YdhG (YjbR/CyaY superfamily)